MINYLHNVIMQTEDFFIYNILLYNIKVIQNLNCYVNNFKN